MHLQFLPKVLKAVPIVYGVRYCSATKPPHLLGTVNLYEANITDLASKCITFCIAVGIASESILFNPGRHSKFQLGLTLPRLIPVSPWVTFSVV